jgi:hypothetical protein
MNDMRQTAIANLEALRRPVTPQTVDAELRRLHEANALHRTLGRGCLDLVSA